MLATRALGGLLSPSSRLQYWVDVTAKDGATNVVKCVDRPGEATHFTATGAALSDVAVWCNDDFYHVTFIPHTSGSQQITVTYSGTVPPATVGQQIVDFDPGLFEAPAFVQPTFSTNTCLCPPQSVADTPQASSRQTTARPPRGQLQ